MTSILRKIQFLLIALMGFASATSGHAGETSFGSQRCLLNDVWFETQSEKQSAALTHAGATCIAQHSCLKADDVNCYGGIERKEVVSADSFHLIAKDYSDYQALIFGKSEGDVAARKTMEGKRILFPGAILTKFATAVLGDYYAEFMFSGGQIECNVLYENKDVIVKQLLHVQPGGKYMLSGNFSGSTEKQGFFVDREVILSDCRLDAW
jgi:hypothetical protein